MKMYLILITITAVFAATSLAKAGEKTISNHQIAYEKKIKTFEVSTSEVNF